MESFLKSACAALALIALAAPQAEAQDTTAAAAAATPAAVGSFKSWSAYTFEDKGRLMCYTQSAPTGTVGGAEGRGAAAVMVIQAPDAAARDQVSIVLGFLPQDGRNVTVTIGAKPGKGKKFTLKKFAVGRAWAETGSDVGPGRDAVQDDADEHRRAAQHEAVRRRARRHDDVDHDADHDHVAERAEARPLPVDNADVMSKRS